MALDKLVRFRIPSKNVTRWNSQFAQLFRIVKALEKQPSIQPTLSAFKKHGSLSVKEMKVIKEVMLILQPFKEAKDAFQKEHESVGVVIPGYQLMVNTMTALSNPASVKITHCKDFAKCLLASLETRLSYVLKDIIYLLGE